MARAHTIWLVQLSHTMEVLKAFTVKREMIGWIRHTKEHDLSMHDVYKITDCRGEDAVFVASANWFLENN